MKTLREYILEHLSPIHIYEDTFYIKNWSHNGKYDYAKAVVQSLLDGKELLLGKNGEGIGGVTHVSKKDFDVNALKNINKRLDAIINGKFIETPPTVGDFIDAFKNNKNKNEKQKQNIWTSLFKGDFSGKRGKGGIVFEHIMASNIQTLILNNGKLPDDTPHKKVSEELFKKIKDTHTIKELLGMRKRHKLDESNIGSYVRVSGKGKTARNAYNQIINTNTFEVNISKKNTLTHETEDEIENVLTQSGKIIADITITLEGDKFNKSDIKHVNKNDIYISCKDGDSQFSGISMQQPFYGDSQKTNNNSYIVRCYKNDISYEDFINCKFEPISDDDKVCVNAYKNLCNFMGVDGEVVYNYFKQPKNERPEKQPLDIAKSDEENDEVIATLIQLLIGGNYWYVNSSGVIAYIDDDIDGNRFTFIPSKKGQLDSSQIKISGMIKTGKDNFAKCDLKFRNADKEDYPFRLFIYPDKHIISKLFSQNNENS